jgi:hypothetical protein
LRYTPLDVSIQLDNQAKDNSKTINSDLTHESVIVPYEKPQSNSRHQDRPFTLNQLDLSKIVDTPDRKSSTKTKNSVHTSTKSKPSRKESNSKPKKTLKSKENSASKP